MNQNRFWYSGGLKEWIFTTDHKKIGIMYFFTSFIFFSDCWFDGNVNKI